MGLIDWLTGPPKETTSSEDAKKRLQLTIFHDRMEIMKLSSEELTNLKKELLEVIAKYFEVNNVEIQTRPFSSSSKSLIRSSIPFIFPL